MNKIAFQTNVRVNDWTAELAVIASSALFGIFFAENCMEMKKNWTKGRERPSRLLDLPLVCCKFVLVCLFNF